MSGYGAPPDCAVKNWPPWRAFRSTTSSGSNKASTQVLAALARAPRLSTAERDLLYRAAVPSRPPRASCHDTSVHEPPASSTGSSTPRSRCSLRAGTSSTRTRSGRPFSESPKRSRHAIATYPDDRELTALVTELRETSRSFTERWNDFAVLSNRRNGRRSTARRSVSSRSTATYWPVRVCPRA